MTKVENGFEYEVALGRGKLFLGHLPGRKSWCLYVVELGMVFTIAHVRNDQEAQRLMNCYEGEPIIQRADIPKEDPE